MKGEKQVFNLHPSIKNCNKATAKLVSPLDKLITSGFLLKKASLLKINDTSDILI